ncbi:MAG: glycosyltransferase [Gammaproteobacteria bacterium]|nr:glycosyltransferase [Gammaproteobacteria bacterium]MBL6999655.1 glycosyltransferase [Gammaproteobacteria bacterium]
MDISVVIPSYNRAHTLGRALTSVFSQHYPAQEVIVIDDGSSDHTQQLITNEFPQVKLIIQNNAGVSAARNSGIRAARSDWIALLDSDDEWLPEKLERIQLAQQQHPALKLFHSDEIWIRNGVRVNPMNKHAKSGGHIFQNCLPLCVISPSATVIHRAIFDQIGLFDETLPACEDYDLWLRLCHRYPVHYIDQALIRKYGGHDDQLSARYWGMDRFRIRALHRLLDAPTLQPEQKAQAIQMLIKKLRILLKGANKHQNQALLDEFSPLLQHYESLPC